jgi:hypothetical protein
MILLSEREEFYFNNKEKHGCINEEN